MKDKPSKRFMSPMTTRGIIVLLIVFVLYVLFKPVSSVVEVQTSSKLKIPVVEEEFNTLIVIPSITTQIQYHYRKAIRSTWKKSLPSSMKLLFFIGKNDLNSQDKNALELELQQNDDIILLDISENYNMLSHKMVAIYKYIDENKHNFKGLKWIFKTDTDIWLNAQKLQSILLEYEPQKVVIGRVYKNAPVLRSGPWENKEYTASYYPQYMAGAGYALSVDILYWLVKQDQNGWLKYMNNEDALLGIWLAGLNVDMINHDGIHPNIFSHNRKFRRPIPKYCNKESVLIHNLSRRGVLITFETFSKCQSPCLDDCPADIQQELSKFLSGPEMFQKLMHDKLDIDI
eukprot:NODE_13_length_54415_cov_0.522424.p17 type:complete len:344 gc:universal NODE_13_length_54415_cov_0.522424:14320-13289(-)